MWLKTTKVKSSKGERRYLQVVRSYHDDGRNRQKLIANLGRADEVDLKLAGALIDALNCKTGDTLSPEAISLLKTKEYGSVILILRAYANTGLQRFFSDLGKQGYNLKALDRAVMLIITYTILCDDSGLSLMKWAKTLYLPWRDEIASGDFEGAFALLSRPEIVYRAITSMLEGNNVFPAANLRFICPISLAAKGKSRVMRACIDTNLNFFPSKIHILSESSADPENPGPLFILDARYTGEGIRSFRQADYLCRLQLHNLSLWFDHEAAVVDTLQQGGDFMPWRGGGFREVNLNGERLLVLRPEAGEAPSLSSGYVEPREVLITNLPDPSDRICSMAYQHELFCENLYKLVYPPEAREAVQKGDTLINTALLRLLIAHNLEENVSGGMTMSEIIRAVSGIKVFEINDREFHRLYHTELSKEQATILTAMGFRPHPKLNKI